MNLPILVSSMFFFCAAAQTLDGRSNRLFHAATRHLTNDDRRFLCEHNCQVHTTRRRNEGGPSRWTMAYFKCDNMEQAIVSTVICDRFCVNPVTCTRMRKYVNRPVTYNLRFTTRRDETRIIPIQVACNCQLRKPRPTCPTRKLRRRNRT